MLKNESLYRLLTATAAKARIEGLQAELRALPWWAVISRWKLEARIDFMQLIHDRELDLRRRTFKRELNSVGTERGVIDGYTT